MTYPDIFGPTASGVVQKAVTKARLQNAFMFVLTATAVLSAIGATGLLIFEYELIFRVFDNVTGDENPYFTPAIMGLSAAIVVLAMIYLHKQKKSTKIMGFLASSAAILVRIYAIGFGLMVLMLLLSAGGLTDFISSQSVDMFKDSMDDIPPHWLELAIGNYVGPFAGVLFSAAVGGLVVLNLYTSHQALHFTIDSFKRIVAIRNEYRIVMEDAHIFKASRKAWDKTDNERHQLLNNDDKLRYDVASDALMAIQYGVQKGLKAQRAQFVAGEQFSLLATPQPDISDTDTALNTLRAITLNTLVKHTK